MILKTTVFCPFFFDSPTISCNLLPSSAITNRDGALHTVVHILWAAWPRGLALSCSPKITRCAQLRFSE
jgi:hypothetical protein